MIKPKDIDFRSSMLKNRICPYDDRGWLKAFSGASNKLLDIIINRLCNKVWFYYDTQDVLLRQLRLKMLMD